MEEGQEEFHQEPKDDYERSREQQRQQRDEYSEWVRNHTVDTRDIHDTKIYSLTELSNGTLLCSFSEDGCCVEAWNYSPNEGNFQHLWEIGHERHKVPPTSIIELGDELIAVSTLKNYIWDLKKRRGHLVR